MKFSQQKLSCKSCGAEFWVQKYRSMTARYCSQKCYGVSLLGHTLAKGRPRPSMCGERHWRWISDRTKVKGLNERNNPEYKQWRGRVLSRDGYRCLDCGEIKKGEMEADHIFGWAKFPRLRYFVENGQTLCKDCHKNKTFNSLVVAC